MADTQAAFAAALRNPRAPVPAGITAWTGDAPKRRFDVYRNNVYSSLAEVLEGRYPAVRRLVGEEFFRAMARVFIDARPPATPMLMDYGEGFAEFLDGFAPVGELPYLGDVARIEWAWSRAYHAIDAVPLVPARLGTVAPEDLDHLHLRLHPSLHLLTSAYPAFAIWQTNTDDGEVIPIDLAGGGQETIVVRPRLAVEVRQLPPGAYRFLDAIARKTPLGAAAAAASAVEGFDLEMNLRELLRLGAFCDFAIDEGGADDSC
ncbi:MAG: DUF2063 domain-containing protein [Flavobacteriaceae bacterium]